MKYAVNLADLTKYVGLEDGLHPVMLLLQPVLTREIVHCEEPRFDGGALLIAADVEKARIDAILWLLRHRLGVARNALRIYEGTGNAKIWKRLEAPAADAEPEDEEGEEQ